MMNTRLDRLSALVSRFALRVSPDAYERANLAICSPADGDQADRIIFTPDGNLTDCRLCMTEPLFLARVEWGGSDNPLVSTLPRRIDLSIADDCEMQSLAMLLVAENRDQRCGSGTVINRLGEVLLVRLLRAQLAAGTTDTGILGGLADVRLSPAIVAMHEKPGKTWRIDHLAEIAGLSVSRFADRFTSTVGQTPMSYLRHWRMLLARQDVERGDRIQSVALRYGYSSSEAMTRAFRRQFGSSPTSMRRKI